MTFEECIAAAAEALAAGVRDYNERDKTAGDVAGTRGGMK